MAKYQTRKSPAFHAGDCKGLTKKGKDGDYVSTPDSRGVHKWIKVRKTRKGAKIYDVHDNGSRPFRVVISGKVVEIFKGKYDEENDVYDYSQLVKKLAVKHVHLGESTCDPAAGADACGKRTRGNTILLHVSGNKYIYVGQEVYEFTMEDDFVAYYSIIGNSDVPYPITLGSKYVYFMIDGDHTYLPRELITANMNATEWANAYAYYYGLLSPTTGKKQDYDPTAERLKNVATKMKGFKMISGKGVH